MPGNYIFTEELALKALEIVKPSIDAFLQWENAALAVAIVVPGAEGDTLLERVFGNSAEGKRYQDIARGKALLANREKMPTRKILQEAPSLLRTGDVRYAGGVYEPGVAVGASGL